MSPKSRRKTKKFTGTRQVRPASATPASPVTRIERSVSQSRPAVSKPVDSAPPAAVYTNITREIKTIGIIGGVLLVVLIILGKVLA